MSRELLNFLKWLVKEYLTESVGNLEFQEKEIVKKYVSAWDIKEAEGTMVITLGNGTKRWFKITEI